MKKIIIIILLLVSTITCLRVEDRSQETFDYVYNKISSTKTRYVMRKTTCLLEKAEKYGINPIVLVNLGYTESTFRHYLVNKNSGCIGLYQIDPKWWKHLVHYVEDGKYSESVNMNGDYEKYMKYIGVNTEMACIILREYINIDGNYRDALIRYGGWKNHKNKEKMREYIRRISG